MGFKKILIDIPSQGYTGETVKHTVTKTNLKNQPELEGLGIKEGDEIDIVKPVENAPVIKSEKKSNTSNTDQGTAKVTRGNASAAKSIADVQNVDAVFENSKGEFFTSENLALLSEKGVKDKIITHTF